MLLIMDNPIYKKSMDNKKKEIVIKKNPKAVALEKAPDEVIAMAIRDAINKDKEKNQKEYHKYEK